MSCACEEIVVDPCEESFLIEDCDSVLICVEAQGETGPSGASGGDALFAAENKDVVTIKAGQPVSIHTSGVGVVLASAADALKPCIALASSDVLATVSGDYQSDGLFTLADWTEVTGTVLLAARGIYFLDAVSGKLSTTPLVTPGQVLQLVGRAVDTTTLDLDIELPILL